MEQIVFGVRGEITWAGGSCTGSAHFQDDGKIRFIIDGGQSLTSCPDGGALLSVPRDPEHGWPDRYEIVHFEMCKPDKAIFTASKGKEPEHEN